MELFKHYCNENYEFDNDKDPYNFFTLILIVDIIQNIKLPLNLIKFRVFLLYTLIVEVYLLILDK